MYRSVDREDFQIFCMYGSVDGEDFQIFCMYRNVDGEDFKYFACIEVWIGKISKYFTYEMGVLSTLLIVDLSPAYKATVQSFTGSWTT